MLFRSIFSVNDVSGIPSVEVLDTGLVKLAQYSGNVLLGTATDNGKKLQVNGDATINGSVTTTSLTTGAVSTAGTITGTWTLAGASTLQATYADLAEFYEGDMIYEPGTVLIFGGDKEVTTTTIINDTRVAGIVSTAPAYIMNAEQHGEKICLGLIGRVPCKVIGKVNKGDPLTTSWLSGYATKAENIIPTTIIGKALEHKIYDEPGLIEVSIGRA